MFGSLCVLKSSLCEPYSCYFPKKDSIQQDIYAKYLSTDYRASLKG